jgi:2-dehydro-3-deoxyphosphogluconate aldolase/(4S)-4-hydroxy-2-oxoglutarate aldolase
MPEPAPFQVIAARRLLPAVTGLERPEQAVALARALIAGGLDVMEITLRHDSSLECIQAISEQVPEMTIGAGTIIQPHQVPDAMKSGATFGVSPGFNPDTIITALEEGMPFIPGIATGGELEQAVAMGCSLVKFFPCEPLGGVAWLQAISGPYLQTGVRIVPMGGIRTGNLADYTNLPIVAAAGGSWMAAADLIRHENWDEVTELTRAALARIVAI